MQPGANSPDGDAEDVGDLIVRKVHVVLEDEDRTLLCGEPGEAPFKLIAVIDGNVRIPVRPIGPLDGSEVLAAAAVFGVGGVHQKPI